MTAFDVAQADLQLAADGSIDMDIQCASCGYNLRGLSPDGRCPECGTAVGRSTRGDFLRFCDPAWVETLASGMNWIVASLIVGLVVGVFAGGAASLTGKPGFGLIGILGGLVGLIGYWKVTTADPREQAAQGLDVRAIIRYGSILNLVLSMVSVVVPPLSIPWKVIVVPSGALGLVVSVSLFVYARRMARRIPDERLASQTGTVMWGFVAMSVLWMLYSAMMIIFGPQIIAGIMPTPAGGPGGTGGAAVPTIPPAFYAFMGLACVLGVVSLVFSIWALVLIIRYRRAFSLAALEARATWAGNVPDASASGSPAA